MIDLKILSQEELLDELESCKRNYVQNIPDEMLFDRVLHLATFIHAHQSVRPDGLYINHIMRVAIRVCHLGVRNIEPIIAALLHDSVEDQSEMLSDLCMKEYKLSTKQKELTNRERAFLYLEYKFGDTVRFIIEKLTNPLLSEDISDNTKVEIYQKHVKELIDDLPYTAIIKLADFCDNGLYLKDVKNQETRKKLCVKYKPVFGFFIRAITNGKINIMEKQKNNILADLKNAEIFARSKVD